MQQLLFILLAGTAGYFAFKQYRKIYNNILLGKSTELSGSPAERWSNVLLVAFGQKNVQKLDSCSLSPIYLCCIFIYTDRIDRDYH